MYLESSNNNKDVMIGSIKIMQQYFFPIYVNNFYNLISESLAITDLYINYYFLWAIASIE